MKSTLKIKKIKWEVSYNTGNLDFQFDLVELGKTGKKMDYYQRGSQVV